MPKPPLKEPSYDDGGESESEDSPDMMIAFGKKPDSEGDDEESSAQDKACKELASMLGVDSTKYDAFRRLLKVATGG